MSFSDQSFSEIEKILTSPTIPLHQKIFDISDEVSDILMVEPLDYRPKASNGEPGSLLDFHDDGEATLVVPDLHARPYFLLNILRFPLASGKTVFQALQEKSVRLVFVGDILHTEKNSRDRWTHAQAEFDQGIFTGPAISAEMLEGLNLLCGLMKLKSLFPENCHILKGNHENIYNETGKGDYAFKKYADEGNMSRIFIQEYYGEDILYMIHCFEKALPLFFWGKKCLVSHAEPKKSYLKQEIIDARIYPQVIEGLTWTANDQAEEESVLGIIKNLTGKDDAGDYVYLGGHRPVPEKYKLRQNGLFIQFHNPNGQNIALVSGDKKFNPDSDIVEVAK